MFGRRAINSFFLVEYLSDAKFTKQAQLEGKDPSPMVGLQVFHAEWLTSLVSLSEMDVSESRSIHMGDFYSPGLFIGENVWDSMLTLILRWLNGISQKLG